MANTIGISAANRRINGVAMRRNPNSANRHRTTRLPFRVDNLRESRRCRRSRRSSGLCVAKATRAPSVASTVPQHVAEEKRSAVAGGTLSYNSRGPPAPCPGVCVVIDRSRRFAVSIVRICVPLKVSDALQYAVLPLHSLLEVNTCAYCLYCCDPVHINVLLTRYTYIK